jgi:hypothetical protein
MDTLNNAHVVLILAGYIVTQALTATLIYWALSRQSTAQIKSLFESRGKEHFIAGFNDELRSTITRAIKESQADVLTLVYDHVNKELAATTQVTRELVSERLREIDARIMDMRDALRKIDMMRDEMSVTNKIIGVMSERLNRFFEEAK